MCWLVVAAAGVVGETLVLLSPSLSLFLFLSLHFGNSLLLGATTTVPTQNLLRLLLLLLLRPACSDTSYTYGTVRFNIQHRINIFRCDTNTLHSSIVSAAATAAAAADNDNGNGVGSIGRITIVSAATAAAAADNDNSNGVGSIDRINIVSADPNAADAVNGDGDGSTDCIIVVFTTAAASASATSATVADDIGDGSIDRTIIVTLRRQNYIDGARCQVFIALNTTGLFARLADHGVQFVLA